MAAGAYDRRGSSIATQVDAAIERVVQQFESEDLALRLDVLRALSAQARLAFETTRVRERLAQHPVSSDLIQGVTSQSPVYKALAERLTVDSCSCDYDARRNVLMTTDVRWTHAPASAKKATKKRKKAAAAAKSADKGAMITKYRFERARQQKETAEDAEEEQQEEQEEQEEENDDREQEEETLIKFTVVVAFGDDDATPRELLHYELACEHPYPKSYYEDQQQLPSDDEEEEKKEEKEEEQEEEGKRNRLARRSEASALTTRCLPTWARGWARTRRSWTPWTSWASSWRCQCTRTSGSWTSACAKFCSRAEWEAVTAMRRMEVASRARRTQAATSRSLQRRKTTRTELP